MIESLKNNNVLAGIFSPETLTHILRIAAYLIVGLLLIRLIIVIFRKLTTNKVSQQFRMIVEKIINYTGITILAMMILAELGANLAAILGAAGVLGIAIGVASQKSLGNMVSGLFLLSEKSFEIGDLLKIDDKTGIVQDIDLLALKIRTFDNKLIRIPNETLVSNIVTNITKYPIRRLDISLSVSYGDDLTKTEEALLEATRSNPLILDEPKPLFLLKTFGDNGIELLFGFWCFKADYIEARNSAFRDIITNLSAAGISIPFPQITIHNGMDWPEGLASSVVSQHDSSLRKE